MNGKADHSGHRERLKERFQQEGLDHFQIHNALELLLFYSVPYKDTNETAHILLNTFGSIRNVLDAPFDELIQIDGIGKNSALLIKLVTDVVRLSRKEFNDNVRILDNSVVSKKYCENLFYGSTQESVHVICLDNSNNLIHQESVSTGTVNRSYVEKRNLLETVVRHNTASVILTHNHPRGDCLASATDLNFTMEVKLLLSNIGVVLNDHIIVGEWASYSMAQQDGFKSMF